MILVPPLPPAMEETAIPQIGDYGKRCEQGAAMFFALLCYPCHGERTRRDAYQRRTQLIEAINARLILTANRSTGIRRVSKLRAKTGMQRPPMKNADAIRVIRKAQKILARRVTHGGICNQLDDRHANEAWEAAGVPFDWKVAGPASLDAALQFTASGLRGTSEARRRKAWRYWKESGPVLHLAFAWHLQKIRSKDDDSPESIVKHVRHAKVWFEEVMTRSELKARKLPLICSFDPARRETLSPK